ncbi:MAG: endolytic transglycosylase MltG [Nitrospirae bacterium]|nr:endolytic transglycosylase MltG [Nitrospirota bacterium]
MKTNQVNTVIGIIVILAILIFLASYSSLFAMRSSNKEVRIFEVPEGVTVKWIAGRLEKEGIISNSTLFMLAGRFLLSDKYVKAGEYLFTVDMSLIEVISAFQEGKVNYRTVTIPDGAKIDRIGEILQDEGLVDKETFGQLTRNQGLIKLLNLDTEIDSLEGFLYPDTYYFIKGSTPDRVVRKMVMRFKKLFTPDMERRAAELKMSVKDVVTLASVIEKESGSESERPLISAVFHNRLRLKMPLQSDPTVIYALGEGFDGDLKKNDLRFKSSYNTYLQRGLPPGPIGSPTIGSLHAALYPADVDYLYFVSMNDGTHYFSNNFDEHDKAVTLYQRSLALKKNQN